jgi:predicted DsbA family dithiol-disulfide isomerase
MAQQLEIYSDLICPWCYIGKRRLEAAQRLSDDVRAAHVTWHPFQLNPDMPPAGVDRRTYRTQKFGSWEHSLELDSQVVLAGADVGITFNYSTVQRTPNTFDSHRLIWLAAGFGNQDQLVEALFAAYFVEGRDLSQRSELVAVAVAAGLPRDAVQKLLTSDQGAAEVRAEEQAARTLGVQGVPFYVVDRRLGFSGAQPPEFFVDAFQQAAHELEPATAASGDSCSVDPATGKRSC